MKYIMGLILFFTINWAQGQRHTRCDLGVEALGGVSQFGYAGQLGVIKNFSDKLFVKGSFLYGIEQNRSLNHQVLAADIWVGYTLFSINDFYFSLGLGGTASQEKDPPNDLFKAEKYGGLGAIEIEKYFTDRLSVVAHGDYRFVTKDEFEIWGQQRWYALAGVRFHFYSKKCDQTSSSGSKGASSRKKKASKGGKKPGNRKKRMSLYRSTDQQ